LTGYEASSVAEIGAILDASPATADDVYLETMNYSERAIAAVAAKRSGSGGGGSSVILEHKVTLQSSDILTLDTTPFTLVPAVTGKIIVPLSFIGRMHYGTTTYAEAGQARVFLGDTWGTRSWSSHLGATTVITATLDTAAFYTADSYFSSMIGDDFEELTALVNVPFRFDEAAAVTDGDGTVDFTTLYYLLTP
jgi:hypothetical protein